MEAAVFTLIPLSLSEVVLVAVISVEAPVIVRLPLFTIPYWSASPVFTSKFPLKETFAPLAIVRAGAAVVVELIFAFSNVKVPWAVASIITRFVLARVFWIIPLKDIGVAGAFVTISLVYFHISLSFEIVMSAFLPFKSSGSISNSPWKEALAERVSGDPLVMVVSPFLRVAMIPSSFGVAVGVILAVFGTWSPSWSITSVVAYWSHFTEMLPMPSVSGVAIPTV